MAHKVMVDGTVYEVTGGKTLIDGTEYSIKNGKTMVDGTVYGIEFAHGTTIVTITGRSSEGCAIVIIDGTTYRSDTTIEVPIGTVVECRATTDDAVYLTAKIYVNGEVVANSLDTRKSTVTYLYTVTCNATINLQETYEDKNGNKGYSSTVTITEE